MAKYMMPYNCKRMHSTLGLLYSELDALKATVVDNEFDENYKNIILVLKLTFPIKIVFTNW